MRVKSSESIKKIKTDEFTEKINDNIINPSEKNLNYDKTEHYFYCFSPNLSKNQRPSNFSLNSQNKEKVERCQSSEINEKVHVEKFEEIIIPNEKPFFFKKKQLFNLKPPKNSNNCKNNTRFSYFSNNSLTQSKDIFESNLFLKRTEENFDKICNFKNYFPEYNFSNIKFIQQKENNLIYLRKERKKKTKLSKISQYTFYLDIMLHSLKRKKYKQPQTLEMDLSIRCSEVKSKKKLFSDVNFDGEKKLKKMITPKAKKFDNFKKIIKLALKKKKIENKNKGRFKRVLCLLKEIICKVFKKKK